MAKFDMTFAKVKSMTVDTNVISDMPALIALIGKLEEHGRLEPIEQEYFQRCRASQKALYLMLDFDVEKIGIKVVYKELLKRPPLHRLYRQIFSMEAENSRECNGLAEKYVKKAALPAADATIAAIASLNRIDVLLSWNRDHLTNPNSKKTIEEINRACGIPSPAIITPRDFLDRFIRSDKKTFGLSPSPVLPVFRVDSYSSKLRF